HIGQFRDGDPQLQTPQIEALPYQGIPTLALPFWPDACYGYCVLDCSKYQRSRFPWNGPRLSTKKLTSTAKSAPRLTASFSFPAGRTTCLAEALECAWRSSDPLPGAAFLNGIVGVRTAALCGAAS